jgi:uncharacterized protein YbjT (DUF2867 family)
LNCHENQIHRNQTEEDDMITVMGATGHTGKKIAESLLKAGEKVRALGRSESKLGELKSAGAEVLTGDTTDAAFLTKAFRGADAVYTLVPTDRRAPDCRIAQDQQGETIVKAIREGGVPYVVALSSLGADLSEGTGPIAGLHAQEERLKRLEGANVLLLRPVSFFENFYDALPLIKQQGINGNSVAPNLAVPMIATRDIADVAANALSARDWMGVMVRELLGPRDLNLRRGDAHHGREHWQTGSAIRPVLLRRHGRGARPGRLVRKLRKSLCRDDARFQRGNDPTPPNTREYHSHAVRGLCAGVSARLPGSVRE